MSYGYCPRCGAPGKNRERRPNGNDTCERGCVYPSMSATAAPIAPVDPPPRLGRDDIDLIDALVWAGCINRVIAREVAANAQPGRVATYIVEKGLVPMIAPPQVIIAALAKGEGEDWNKTLAAALELVNRHDFSSRGLSHVDCAELHDVCPHKPETD